VFPTPPKPMSRRYTWRRRFALVLLLALTAAVTLSALDMLPAGLFPDRLTDHPAGDRRITIAVLGDSDSQGYRDLHWNPLPARGGAYRDITLQWTEVLARLRANEVDLGDFGWWGGRGKLVHLLEWFGCKRRLPRKLDHQYNFAYGAAHCRGLVEGDYRQAPQLLALMDRAPERWTEGVVIIRIGIVDLGGDMLATMAQDSTAPEVAQAIQSCTGHITSTVEMIRSRHPATRFVLVGILDNSDCPPNSEHAESADALRNIAQALDRFDIALQRLADGDPRIAFFDDRAWFREQWGERNLDGAPAYRTVVVGNTLRVVHAAGDAPTNSVLADRHAGLAWNTLWCQSLSKVLANELDLPIAPIRDQEVEQFLDAQCSARR
jgi:hypothetical protein